MGEDKTIQNQGVTDSFDPPHINDDGGVCIKDTTIPRIIQRFYSESGQLTGVSILVEERELRTTVGQFLQWHRDQDPGLYQK